jgi:predicted ATPase
MRNPVPPGGTAPNNLPRMLNTFVGREREIEEITALLETNRLVTLVGSGGLGKTRISLHVAANVLDRSGDGVWFVELAPLTSGDYVPSTIAHVLGITLPNEGDPVENLARALRAKHLLLILDNCEHLVLPVAHLVSALLRDCPRLTILASSRQILEVAGETSYRMPTLDVPTALQAVMLTAEHAPNFSAIALFIERTRAVDERFRLTDDNAPIVADICRRLDGIALAIEIAASRVKILTPRELRDRLDERFRVLTGGSRDLLPRQQTLRMLIDWSHDLLEERESRLFRRLGIFVDSFTLASAVAVGADDGLNAIELFDLLESLVDKSLVIAAGAAEEERFRLFESTRAFALEQLDAANEHALIAERHVRYLRDRYAALVADLDRTGKQQPRAAQFGIDLEDIRAALGWALSADHVEDGAQLLAALRGLWGDYGLETESITWHQLYIAALRPDSFALLAQLSIDLATVLDDRGWHVRTREIAPRAADYARATNDPTTLLRALYALAWMHLRDNQIADADRVIGEAEQVANPPIIVRLRIMATRAVLSYMQGDYDDTVRLFEDILREHRALGNAGEALLAATNLANAEHIRGETHRAIAIAEEFLPAARNDPDTSRRALLLGNLAGFLVAVDNLLGAAEIAREVIELLGVDDATHFCVSLAVEALALGYAIVGDLQRAALLAGYSDATFRAVGYGREAGEQRNLDRLMMLLRAGLPEDEIERIMAEGRRLEPLAAFTLALALANVNAET